MTSLSSAKISDRNRQSYAMQGLVLFILFSLTNINNIHAQKEYFKDWSKGEKAFINKEYTPDTVKDASTLIVASYFEYDIKQLYTRHEVKFINHVQYKIKDRYALESFSQFSYNNNNKPEIHIIKPDGKWISVDLSQSITSQGTISTGDYIYTMSGASKIALTQLEIGDIIDYRIKGKYYTGDIRRLGPGEIMISALGIMTPFVFAVPTFLYRSAKMPAGSLPRDRINLKTNFPILKRRIRINTKNVEFYSRSYNDAPEFKLKNGKYPSYEFTDGYRTAIKPEYFAFESNNEPYIRFGFKTPIHQDLSFIFRNGSNPVSAKEIGLVASHMLYNSLYIRYSSSLQKQFKYTKEGKLPPENTIESKIAYLENYYRYLNKTNSHFGDFKLTVCLARMAEKMKLPYQIIAAMPRDEGQGTDDATAPADLSWGLLVSDGEQEYMLTEFNEYACKEDVYSMIKGTDIILIKPNRSKRKVITETISIPADNPEDNLYSIESVVSFEKNISSLQCSNRYTVTGERKKYYYENLQSDYAHLLKTRKENELSTLFLSEFHYEEDMRKSLSSETTRISKVLEKRVDEYYKDYFTESLGDDYPGALVTLGNYEVMNDGRKKKNRKKEDPDKIHYSVSFRLDNYVYYIGKDSNMLSVELGRLITPQTDISERSDRTRQYPIDLDETRSFQTTIIITLPAGYKALNTEDFNKKVDNETGLFISTCTTDGSKLTLTVKKSYKQLHMDASKWPLMLQFLDAASLLQTSKLFLVKI